MDISALSETSNKKQKKHFHFVDSLRGIGAFSVILYHIYTRGRIVNLSRILPD